MRDAFVPPKSYDDGYDDDYDDDYDDGYGDLAQKNAASRSKSLITH